MVMRDSSVGIRNPGFLKLLIIMGLVEGTSTLVLVWAVLMKRVFVQPWGGDAVSITGSIHGLLFVALVVMLIMGRFMIPISGRLMAWGLLGAVVPFGPFLVDIPLYRMLKRASAPSGSE